jgi:hypothetical protein
MEFISKSEPTETEDGVLLSGTLYDDDGNEIKKVEFEFLKEQPESKLERFLNALEILKLGSE